MSRRRWLLAVASFFALAAGPASESNPIAILVRSDLPLDNLPFTELRRLMQADRQFWL